MARVVILVLEPTWHQSLIDNKENELQQLINDAYYKLVDDIIVCVLPGNTQTCPDKLFNQIKTTLNLTPPVEIWIFWNHPHVNNKWQIGQAKRTAQLNPIVGALIVPHKLTDIINSKGELQGEPYRTLNDPLIIIFTYKRAGEDAGYAEWDNTLKLKDKDKAKFYGDGFKEIRTDPRMVEVKVGEYTILFVKENGYEKDDGGGIDKLLSQILKQKHYNSIPVNERYVAVHDIDSYVKDVSQFKDKVKYICGFHHYDTDPHKTFWNALLKLLQNIEENQTAEAKKTCQKIIELIKELSIQLVERLSILKHRIAHLWLPLDIDLQGVIECWNDGRKGKRSPDDALNYLKEVLESKNGDTQYYRQKLTKLQYSIAGEHVDFSLANGNIKCGDSEIKECNPVKPKDEENLLSDNKSIYDLILESDKKDVLDSKDWQAIKLLSGLMTINGADEKNPTNKIYKPIDYKDSPIFKFMCLLDCKIQKYINNPDLIKKNNVNDILNHQPLKDFLENLRQSSDSPFHYSNTPSFRPPYFHSWFCALDDCLNKLRVKLTKRENES